MTDDSKGEQLLEILVHLVGRSVVPVEQLQRIIAPTRQSEKNIRAFNLCDGSRTQAQIVKELHLNQGNFSTTVSRWETAGVVYRVNAGSEERLLYIYPLPSGRHVKAETEIAKGENKHER